MPEAGRLPRGLCVYGLLGAIVIACGTGTGDAAKPGTTVESTASAPGSDSTTSTVASTAVSTTDATTTTTASNLINPFVPQVSVEGATALLVVEFPDGSSAELTRPADLDLLSEGVTPYAWALVPNQHARDFFIRRGQAKDVVGLFGTPQLLENYQDQAGGIVGFWRPEGWSDVDFLAFQFDSWAVLVYDYRSAEYGGDPMSEQDRQLWATNLHGHETEAGFLRLSSDEPLQVAAAGAYPSPMSLTLWSPERALDLVPEDCDPGFISPIDDGDDFSHWCDSSGSLSIRITGPPDYAQRVHDHLRVDKVQAGEGT